MSGMESIPARVVNRCSWLKLTDLRFGTSRNSPLHHDNRCDPATCLTPSRLAYRVELVPVDRAEA